jgi:hypothetical protein
MSASNTGGPALTLGGELKALNGTPSHPSSGILAHSMPTPPPAVLQRGRACPRFIDGRREILVSKQKNLLCR